MWRILRSPVKRPRDKNMAVSAYVSASWFLRILLVILFCTIITLLSLVVTDSANFLVSRNSKSGLPDDYLSNDSPPSDNGGGAGGANAAEQKAFQGDAGGGEHYADVFNKDSEEATGEAVKKLPDALIIGARKGGTRALITFLAMHPKIVTTGDEVQFFNNNESYAKGIDWYKEQMLPTRPDQILIEKSAEYFHVLYVPERVKAMDPNMKILLIVRDPFVRMVSDYSFLRRFAAANQVEGYEFPELKYTLEELAINNVTGEINLQYGGLHRSKYYKFTKNWMMHFPREQIHIINGDRLASDNPAIELHKVEEFLGIPNYLTEDMFYKDEVKGFYCITKTGCLGKEKGHKPPEFEPAFVEKIRAFLRPHNKLFYELVGEDYGWE